MQYNAQYATQHGNLQKQIPSDSRAFFYNNQDYLMGFLHDGIVAIYSGNYRRHNQIHPTPDLASRWGQLSGLSMERLYVKATERIESAWLNQTDFPLEHKAEYQRHIMRNAAHYLVDLLADDRVFSDLRSRIFAPGNLKVPEDSSKATCVEMCWAVLHRAVYRARDDIITLSDLTAYTWKDLRGDVKQAIYMVAYSKLRSIWRTQIEGRPYSNLFDESVSVLAMAKANVLNQRLISGFMVIGNSKRSVTPTPPNSEHGGSPRPTRHRRLDYDPTEGMSL